ncbi:rod shape-determining protein RodA [Longimicrobium terrae]|uniref:Rod shape determining protein RodA n=1 Tax=Longimicrobium terrae TaxID=1639882 RepID=A0A841GW11_9BACT|nr:rod shape-determining protein RodA [Longimicrobium terrae]MBB4635300.1 rod shape determining protein RodA [Longimicrobium terrae]MBB6069693.1 rod shape determining protein RodA [Longimicrobium terrae]NNC31096.1 rod shape-determining protein RodA [Longimicrobium terrae]
MKRYAQVRLGDPVLFWLVVGLAVFGICMIFSAGAVDVPGTRAEGTWRQQLIFFTLAILLVPVLLRVRFGWLEWGAQPAYALGLVLLMAALVFGSGGTTGASTKSWIRVGPVGLQPSEVAKIATALMLARVLGEWREPPKTLWALWKPIGVVALPMGLVMLQPDLGSALAFASILVWCLYWAGTPVLTIFFLISPLLSLFLSISVWVWGFYIVLLMAMLFWRNAFISEKISIFVANAVAGAVALPLWNMLKPYQKARFMVFLDPASDPRGTGYNLIQSRVAIGSGGWFGKGFMEGPQKRLAFLPEQHTDFIFAVIGEELGFIGVLAVLLTFGLIFWRLIRVAERSRDPFGSLVPIGILGSWFTHVLINVGMTVGVMPVTGIPLPFISYGGSFLLVNLLAMAVIQRIAAEKAR